MLRSMSAWAGAVTGFGMYRSARKRNASSRLPTKTKYRPRGMPTTIARSPLESGFNGKKRKWFLCGLERRLPMKDAIDENAERFGPGGELHRSHVVGDARNYLPVGVSRPAGLRKIFRFRRRANQRYQLAPSRAPQGGALRDRHERWARDAVDAMARKTSAPMRTAKSCGPDTPTLVSSFREANASRERRWQKSPVTGESTI